MRRRQSIIADEEVARCLGLLERSSVPEFLENAIAARYRRPGRLRALSVRALLCALLLLAVDDRALHLLGVIEALKVHRSHLDALDRVPAYLEPLTAREELRMNTSLRTALQVASSTTSVATSRLQTIAPELSRSRLRAQPPGGHRDFGVGNANG